MAKARIDMKLILTPRDIQLISTLSRWRFLIGRQVKELFGFTGQRACDRRLERLVKEGYLERKKIFVAFPSLYFLTVKGKKVGNIKNYSTKHNLDEVEHDIAVVDTVIYFIKGFGIKLEDIITEKELHSADGFGVRKHKPDFVFFDNSRNKRACVEVEFTAKSKKRFLENVRYNFMNYDEQIWIVPQSEKRIISLLKETGMANQHIVFWETIEKYVRGTKE